MLTFKYRYDLGMPVKVCMACAAELKSDKERGYGLCEYHQNHIIKPPGEVRRQFGRGIEYQLLRHTDELDDIIYKLEYEEEAGIHHSSMAAGAWGESGGKANRQSEYLIFSHYIAKIFLNCLLDYLSFTEFDYVVFADSGYVSMEIIFTEMGYLLKDKDQADLFLQGQLQEQLQDQKKTIEIHRRRVLLLDLYRSIETRTCLDRLRLSGAGEVVTVYLTSYS